MDGAVLEAVSCLLLAQAIPTLGVLLAFQVQRVQSQHTQIIKDF